MPGEAAATKSSTITGTMRAWENDPVSIKYYVKRFIQENQARFRGKVVIDTPAGSGITARLLTEVGATVHAFDLFPEYFKAEGLTCTRANLIDGLPLPDDFADFLICQEGIEHLSDQYRVLKEFNRVLKPGGVLIVTTPNYSNLKARLSYFLFETEYLLKNMPPNEVDSIWMVAGPAEQEIYLGHYFLLGIQRLRGLAKLAGFRIRELIFTRLNVTSLILFPFAYPLLLLTGWLTHRTYLRRFRRNRNFPRGSRKRQPLPPEREEVFRELRALNTDYRILLDKHLFVEFEKEVDLRTLHRSLRGQHQGFHVIP